MQSLPIRLVSASVAIGIYFAVAYFLGQWGLLAFCSLVWLLMVREVFRLLFNEKELSGFESSLVLVFLLGQVVLGVTNISYSYYVFTAAMLILYSYLLTARSGQEPAQIYLLSSKLLFFFFYVGVLPSFLMRVLFLDQGVVWFTLSLVMVFLADSFAFFSGSLLGKTKLWKNISPTKSFEGAIGALLGALVGGAVASFFLTEVSIVALLVLSLVVGVFSLHGDLWESLLKRFASRKDSGSLLPGHGGVLDRIDGVLFAGPVIYLGITLIELFKL
jgi:phosphatidate cytidylyltransferase